MRIVSFLTAIAFALSVADAFAPRHQSSAPRATIAPLAASIPTLDNWTLRKDDTLKAKVFGHPDMIDGEYITTSPILDPEQANANSMVRTMTGSQYLLAQPAKSAVAGKVPLFGAFGIAASLFVFLNGPEGPQVPLFTSPISSGTDENVLLRNPRDTVLAVAERETKVTPIEKAEIVNDQSILGAIKTPSQESAAVEVEAPAVESPPVVETETAVAETPIVEMVESQSVKEEATMDISTKTNTVPVMQIGAATLVGAGAISVAVSKRDEFESIVKSALPTEQSSSPSPADTEDSGPFNLYLRQSSSTAAKGDSALESGGDSASGSSSTPASPDVVSATARTSASIGSDDFSSSFASTRLSTSRPLEPSQPLTPSMDRPPASPVESFAPSVSLKSVVSVEPEGIAIVEEDTEVTTDEVAPSEIVSVQDVPAEPETATIPPELVSNVESKEELDDLAIDEEDTTDEVALLENVSVQDVPAEPETATVPPEQVSNVGSKDELDDDAIDDEDTEAPLAAESESILDTHMLGATESSADVAPATEDISAPDEGVIETETLDQMPSKEDLEVTLDVAIDDKDTEMSNTATDSVISDTQMYSIESTVAGPPIEDMSVFEEPTLEIETAFESSSSVEQEATLDIASDDKEREQSIDTEPDSILNTQMDSIESDAAEISPIEDVSVPDASIESETILESLPTAEQEVELDVTHDEEEEDAALDSILDYIGRPTTEASLIEDFSVPDAPNESETTFEPATDIESKLDDAIEDLETELSSAAKSDSIFETEIDSIEDTVAPVQENFASNFPSEPETPTAPIDPFTEGTLAVPVDEEEPDVAPIDADGRMEAPSPSTGENSRVSIHLVESETPEPVSAESSPRLDQGVEPLNGNAQIEIAKEEESTPSVQEPNTIDNESGSVRRVGSETPIVDQQPVEARTSPSSTRLSRGLTSSSWPTTPTRFPRSKPGRATINASAGAFGVDRLSGASSVSVRERRTRSPAAATSGRATTRSWPTSIPQRTKAWDRSTATGITSSTPTPPVTSGPHAVQLESSATASEPIGARSPSGSHRSQKAAAMEKVMKRLQRASQQQQDIMRSSSSGSDGRP